MKKGKVYLIGAGPGDPGLITLKGIQCLKRADVVIYDHLVSEEILAYAQTSVRMIYAGKEGGKHTLTQDQINHALVEEAEKGLIVARLKGGDPFIFGRGGEEVEILAGKGIPFEIVPGVTSAIAVPAYAGIPLTHRSHSSTVAFITGHEDPTKEESHIDWKSLAGIETLVFLMGVKNLPNITSSLIAAGKSPETPAALIRWGTTAEQETLVGTLADLAQLAKTRGFKPPSILVVGSGRFPAPPFELVRDKTAFRPGHRHYPPGSADGRIPRPAPRGRRPDLPFPDDQNCPARGFP